MQNKNYAKFLTITIIARYFPFNKDRFLKVSSLKRTVSPKYLCLKMYHIRLDGTFLKKFTETIIVTIVFLIHIY